VDAEASFEIERRLVAQIRSTGPLRAAQAEIASWLVHRRAWEKLGYARLSDYADERLGRSARSVLDLAHVGLRLQYLSKLRTALVEGRLGWTRVRLVARVTDRLSTSEEQERWIAHARGVTTQNLSREVRKVDRQSIEEGGLDRDKRPSKMFEVACTPEVRGRWLSAQGLASRVNGGRLSLSGAAELMAAEVLSAIPIDPDIADAAEVDEVDSGPGTSWPEAAAAARAECAQRLGLDEDGEGDGEGGGGGTGETAEEGGQVGANGAGLPTIPAEIQALMEDVENADAFELDRRLRAAVAMEQRLDAQIGPLLEWVIRRRVYLVLGYPTREAYVSERLGLDPSWGRALVRIERAARASSSLASAYRQGSVTALQARTSRFAGCARTSIRRCSFVKPTSPRSWGAVGSRPTGKSLRMGRGRGRRTGLESTTGKSVHLRVLRRRPPPSAPTSMQRSSGLFVPSSARSNAGWNGRRADYQPKERHSTPCSSTYSRNGEPSTGRSASRTPSSRATGGAAPCPAAPPCGTCTTTTSYSAPPAAPTTWTTA
jgi:hypothetical protein